MASSNAAHVQVPLLRQPGTSPVRPGQRARSPPGSRGRTSARTGRAPRAPRTAPRRACRGRSRASTGTSCFSASATSRSIEVVSAVRPPHRAPRTASRNSVICAQSPPRSYSVPSASVTDGRAAHGERRLLHEVPGQRRHRVVVAVRLVRLEHRELRRVRGVGALVAEVAVDLEDLLDPADDAALEEQLRRDPQVQVHVERVHVRHERPRRGAAGQHLQHRRLDLEEAAVGGTTRAASGRRRRACAPISRACRPHDQVDVPLPDPGLLGQAPCAAPAAGAAPWPPAASRSAMHRQLAAAGRDHLAVHDDVVAEVDVGLARRERLLADRGQATA